MPEDAKRAAIDAIRSGHREIDALFRSLDEEQLERPVFTGEGAGWRLRDLIAHFAYWQNIAARCAEKMATGVMPDLSQGMRMRLYLGINESVDEVNDANFRAWRERGTAQALDELRRANDRLVAAIDALPEETVAWGEPEGFHPFMWQPGVNHLRQHREHIDAALGTAG